MNKARHNETPYKIVIRNLEYPNQETCIYSQDVSLIATMNGIKDVKTGKWDVTIPVEANARFIVKACNNFYQMKDTILSALGVMTTLDQSKGWVKEITNNFKHVLSQLEDGGNTIPIDERAMNRNSDELQIGIINCVKCGKIYRGNIFSAICPDCREDGK